MENLPPFYVGQEVVCIETHPKGIVKKGQQFVVKGVRKICCNWQIDVGVNTYGYDAHKCTACGKLHPIDSIAWVAYYRFAPITSQFQHIEYSKVLEQEKELIGVN